jgi:DNA-directed RNA polymerase specialized sigma24 family protein
MNGIAYSRGEDQLEQILGPAASLAVQARFAELDRTRNLATARHWIWQYRVDRVQFSPEDALEEAWLILTQRTQKGTARSIRSLTEFRLNFPSILQQVIVDESRRQHAGKRDAGAGIVYLSTLEASGFDEVDQQDSGPEQYAIDKEEGQLLLELLDRQDESLRSIAMKKLEGYTNEQIASSLNASLSTIERKLQEIRCALEQRRDEPR